MIRKVSFLNERRKKIVGVLNLPKSKPPYPAVLICHGFKGQKDQPWLKAQAEGLAKIGILALRIDFTNGVGESDGKLENIKLSQYLSDIDSAVKYLSGLKIVDPER